MGDKRVDDLKAFKQDQLGNPYLTLGESGACCSENTCSYELSHRLRNNYSTDGISPRLDCGAS